MRASAWRVAAGEIALDAATRRRPAPSSARAAAFFPTGEEVGYHTAMEYRFVSGGFLEPGPATVWMRMRGPLVEGEQPTPLQRCWSRPTPATA